MRWGAAVLPRPDVRQQKKTEIWMLDRTRIRALDEEALDILFREARTFSAFEDRPVPEALLRQIWDLARMGPTAANGQPMRVVYVVSRRAKEKLAPALSAGNLAKTMAAPVTAILAYDLEFYENLTRTFPHTDARSWFAGKPEKIEANARQSGSLQAGYFILAARALGLDCGPMNGFDARKLDEAFFAGTSWRSNILVNLGYGRRDTLHPRNPRLSFEEACRIA